MLNDYLKEINAALRAGNHDKATNQKVRKMTPKKATILEFRAEPVQIVNDMVIAAMHAIPIAWSQVACRTLADVADAYSMFIDRIHEPAQVRITAVEGEWPRAAKKVYGACGRNIVMRDPYPYIEIKTPAETRFKLPLAMQEQDVMDYLSRISMLYGGVGDTPSAHTCRAAYIAWQDAKVCQSIMSYSNEGFSVSLVNSQEVEDALERMRKARIKLMEAKQ